MMFANNFIALMQESFEAAFKQERTQIRAMELGVGGLCALGRHTVSRAICAVGREQHDWSADYKIFSRSSWKEECLFDPVIRYYAQRYPNDPFRLAMDDTSLKKTGKKIASAFWQRDSMSPPFHTNLKYGLRFTQMSLLYPHYREGDFPARSIPVRFKECPSVKKPGKRATDEMKAAYKEEKKRKNLSLQGVTEIIKFRAYVDELGYEDRRMIISVDGSLCNKNVLKNLPERTDLVARCRKDAKLCFQAPHGSRAFYSKEKFTPEMIRKDDSISWTQASIYYGGGYRSIKYKRIDFVYWQKVTQKMCLTLYVIAPTPYKKTTTSRVYYRDPSYLLTTSTCCSDDMILQTYFDRWQIEVNHREEKDTLGVGKAQVWSEKAVPRQPTFIVATYSLLLLASIKTFGPGRPEECVALPAWRKKSKRPSALDLVALLRKEMETVGDLAPFSIPNSCRLIRYAYS